MTFEVEITRFSPEPGTVRTRVEAVSEAEAVVCVAAEEIACVLVAQRHGNRHGDEFHIWVAGGRALVRRDAHREWYARDSIWSTSAAAGDLWFQDFDGTQFPAQNGETISRFQAFAALAFWLRTCELLPSLTWG